MKFSLRIILATMLLLVVYAGSASAQFMYNGHDWAYGQQIDVNTTLSFGETATWYHDIPSDLANITRAELWVDLFEYNSITGSGVHSQAFTILDINGSSGGLGDGFWTSPTKMFDIDYPQPVGLPAYNKLRVDRSILVIDYDPETGGGPAPVPEPTTLILFGMGMAGFATRRFLKR